MTLHLEIITPVKIVYKDDVDEVVVPTVKGEIAILPHHVALLTQVTSGELIVKKNGKEQYLAITGGFLEINNNNVSILADYAVRSEDIEVAKAEEAQKRAEKAMQEKVSEKDFAIAEGELRKSLTELKVAVKRRTRTSLPPRS
ncbi:MAG: ATP synthase F1 subunit epsilon [Patescibacteria group bacterium]|nr:ATP synthase F1 subunit epsilon [Patescibacteria group bacterium]